MPIDEQKRSVAIPLAVDELRAMITEAVQKAVKEVEVQRKEEVVIASTEDVAEEKTADTEDHTGEVEE